MNKRIVTIVAVMGCSPASRSSEAPTDLAATETETETEAAETEAAETEPQAAHGTVQRLDGVSRYPGTPPLNARADGKTVYTRDGDCFVYNPVEGPRPPGFFGTPEAVECPPGMTGPAWDLCSFGTLHPVDDGTCHCSQMGNPPPPGFRVSACPVHGDATE